MSEPDEESEDEGAFTLQSLENAKSYLASLRERDSSDTSGNVDKYHTRINRARLEVDHITQHLKLSGAIPYSEKELLEMEINKLFPKARSKDIVEYLGQKYQLKFSPNTKSRSGKTVTSWSSWWQKLP